MCSSPGCSKQGGWMVVVVVVVVVGHIINVI